MKKKYFLSVCLLIKDENRYLPEWLEWHIAQGVEHFYIYDNGSKTPISQDIPDLYKKYCTVVDWAGWHNHTQIDAYGNCISRFYTETEWMAFIDTDEFIRVLGDKSLPDFLSGAEFSAVDAVAAGWVSYNANGLMTRDDRPVRERFTRTVDYPSHMPQCKCIVRMGGNVRLMGAHYPIITDAVPKVVDENGADYLGATCFLTKNKIVVDHYFTRSYEEWREKLARGSCDPNYSRGTEWFQLMNPDMDVSKYDEKGGTYDA